MNILRRLSLSRLLLLCGLVVILGVSLTALAFALGAGPTPPPKPLASAIHDALAGGREHPVQGVSASVTFSDRLLEGAGLASGGHDEQLTSNPLVTGASGRLWVANGRLRLELQSERGDTEIVYDGHTLSVYDAATNTLYKLLPAAGQQPGSGSSEGKLGDAQPQSGREGKPETPSVARIESAIAHLSNHADVSGATPTDVAGQPAYTVRVSPNEGGSLLGGVELSFDSENAIPLRAAVYASTDSSPVLELAADSIAFGPVAESIFQLSPPANAKVEEIKAPSREQQGSASTPQGASKPQLSIHGHGPSAIAVLTAKAPSNKPQAGTEALEGLPKVKIDGVNADELRTELGTLLSFEREGVSYVLAGSVTPAAIEQLAAGL